MEENFYLIITTQDDYRRDINNEFKFIGFPERNKNTVKKFKKGDKVIFYLTRISSFSAIVEITGEYFYNKSQVWNDEYDVWPHRINTKPIHYIKNTEKMIYIKEIWDNLDMIKNKTKWGSQVQGSFRKLSKNDYEVISKAIIEEDKN